MTWSWKRKVVAGAAASLVWLGVAIAVSISPEEAESNPPIAGIEIELPQPTGPHSVGVTTFHWVDQSRPEIMTNDPDDHRELMVHIFYPAASESNPSYAPYFPNAEALRGLLDNSQVSILRSVRTHALMDASLSTGAPNFPVLIFSHGNQSNSSLYTALLEELASHGFVIAAIDHPYDALAVIFPDARLVPFAEKMWRDSRSALGDEEAEIAFYRQRVEVRAEDILFVLDQLRELNDNMDVGRFKRRLDLTHVGVFGHSIGGVAAAEACRRDGRLRACLNMDGVVLGGPFLLSPDGRGPDQPFLALFRHRADPTEEELGQANLNREQWKRNRARLEARQAVLLQSLRSGSYRVILRGAVHESFSDESFLLNRNDPKGNSLQRRIIEIVRAYVVAFFDKYLENRESPLLDGGRNIYPEVEMTRFASAPK